MRFAGSLILGLLAVNGLAQTVIPDQDAEPSAIAQPEPSAPAAEPSNPAQDQPSDPAGDGDAQPTDVDSVPSATNGPEPTAVQPSDEASQASGDEQPTATVSDDGEDASTAEGTATADATATDADATATASETNDEDSTDTATATATFSSAPTSTGTVVEVDLKNATIGENAELVQVDGKPAIKLSAPANGQATFSVAVDSDDELNTDELIYIVASILVGEPSSAKLRRRADKTDCTLQIQADGQNVYEEPLYTNNGQFQDVTSSGIQSSDKPEVQVTQKCGDKPSPLTVNNVRVGNESGVKSSAGSGGSGGGGSGPTPLFAKPGTMRRGRSPSSPSPYRALAHHQQASAAATSSDSISLIRSFNVETNPTRPVRPSPLTASLIRDMPLDLVDRIRSFPLFMSAPEEFLVAIGNHLKPQIQSPNDHIVTEGDEAKAMYWLVRGVVAVTSRDGEAVYAELNPGSFFGEIGVLMQMPRTATIVARTKCLLLVLKKEDLHAVIPKFPEMEKAIREEAQERLNLLKKKRQESGRLVKSPQGDFSAREPAPGEVSTGERGAIKDGAVVNNKKRKSPSPGIMEDPAAGSAIGSGQINIRTTLKELPLFSTLPADILHFLGLSVQPKSYTPFTDIVRQGLPGNEIFFIVRGEAEVIHDEPVYDDNIQNKAKAIPKRPRLKAGQYFGEVASLGLSRGRTATVRSITSVECIMITGDVLDEFWRRCPSDILKQVKETARLRYQKQSDDVVMVDVDVKEKVNKSDPPTPTTPTRASLPDLTFTTPSKPGSPAKDDTSNIAPKDPDPFLSVNMENIRNRRRHSLAPPVPPTDSSTPTTNGARSRLSEVTPIKFAFSDASADDDDVPAKRVRTTLPTRPITMSKPVLSDEILIYIFKHVDIGELFRLRLVSTHWRKLLTTSPKVCQDVDLSIYNRKVTDEVLIKVLAPFIGTRALSIDLNNCFHITDEGFGALWRSCGKNVKKWKMKSVWDVSANQILEMSENAKGLEEVDWSNCRKVGDNLLGRVVGWVVPDPPPSKSVVISSSAARSRSKQQQQKHAAQHVLPPGTVVGCPKLKRLNLSYCKHITDRSMAHLAAHASNRIESLSLTRCTSITDAGFQSWAPFRFEKLSRLCLADCTYLSDNAVVALVNSAKNLTHLDLSFCCALSDTATEVVALRLPKLRELRLAFCGSAVSDGSLESVALHLNDLEALSVRGCVRVTGRGVENVLNGCGRLNWMDVSQCRNLESWIRAGGVSNWGFDDRVGQRSTEPTSSETSGQGQSEDDGPAPKAMSVAMLTSQNFMPRSAFGYRAKRARRPVRFVIEKGFGSLR